MSVLKDLRHQLLKARGSAARLASHLPAPVQERLAGLMGYRYQYEGLNPHVRLLLAIRELQGDGSLITQNPVQSRKRFRSEMASILGKVTPVAQVRDFSIEGPASQLPVRHYQPEQGQGAPLLVFYHGGGFVVGDLDTHDEACRLLCKYGRMHVLSVDYRLAPEHPAPAAVEDCIAALTWAKANAASLGADPDKVCVGGDSAGGNLSAVVSQQTRDTDARPAAQLLIYPVVDLLNDYESRNLFTQGLFLSDVDIERANHAYVELSQLTLESPLVTPAVGEMTNLPPAMVVSAGFDVLRDEGEAYAKQMQAQGNQVLVERIHDQGHGFINITPINREARQATIKMARDFRKFIDERAGCPGNK